MGLTGADGSGLYIYLSLVFAVTLTTVLLPACGSTQSSSGGGEPAVTEISDPAGRKWDLVTDDGLHDPDSITVKYLQKPSGELTELPPGQGGNKVNWVEALAEGIINPKGSLDPDKKEEVLDLDVLLKDTSEMPMITFPHIKHTLWLGCDNCHDHLFERRAGATRNLNMYAVLAGEKCGLCHGAVAFPIVDCIRCHNTPRENESVQHKTLE